jgi:mono/diheme cytochrome c family protein
MNRRLLMLSLLLAAGCAKQTHDMDDQAKLQPQAASAIFADGRASQLPPRGTLISSGGAFADASGGVALESVPRATPMQRLRRGRERYEIFCAPCHGVLGDGDGIVVRRGFPRPPSYHSARLRAADDAYLESVIRDGHGLMFAYGDRVARDDRRAIVAYLRALQRSRHSDVATLSADDRAALAAADAR